MTETRNCGPALVDGAVAGPDVVTFGETMALLSTERLGPLSQAGQMTLSVGGSESNVAIGLARLGRSAAWIGRVGDDPMGQLVETQIRSQGVITRPIVDHERPTGLMIKERRTPSVQRVQYYRTGSAGSRLEPTDVPDELIQSATVLHATGITAALSYSARETVLNAISVAKQAGAAVSFDLNYRTALWSASEAAAFYRDAVPNVDLLFATTSEAATIVGSLASPADYARALVDLGSAAAVITLGPEGALAFDGSTLLSSEAVSVPVVDTIGAGDGFVAGYLAAHLARADIDACLALATRVGAFVCMCPGDWEGLPRVSELELLAREDPVTR